MYKFFPLRCFCLSFLIKKEKRRWIILKEVHPLNFFPSLMSKAPFFIYNSFCLSMRCFIFVVVKPFVVPTKKGFRLISLEEKLLARLNFLGAIIFGIICCTNRSLFILPFVKWYYFGKICMIIFLVAVVIVAVVVII